MHKDINLARDAGDQLGSPTPSAGLADQVLERAEELGYARRDIAALYELLARLGPAADVSQGAARETR